MIRRAPEALISAARMDPDRRDLYVEGLSDKLILEYLLNGSIHRDARILPIDSAVDINVGAGGAKGRILAFARLAEETGIQNLRFLADSDLDVVFNDDMPGNTFLTDFPDMEGYVISERNLDKLLRVAHSKEHPAAQDFHDALMCISSDIGLLRFVSKRNGLNLCVTKTKKSRCISMVSNLPVLDFGRLITTVYQNTPDLQCDVSTLSERIQQAREAFQAVSPSQRIRGKDYIEVMNLALGKLQAGIREAGTALLATMHEENTLSRPRMNSLATFLTGAS